MQKEKKRKILENIENKAKKVKFVKEKILSYIIQPDFYFMIPEDILYELKSKEELCKIASDIAEIITFYD